MTLDSSQTPPNMLYLRKISGPSMAPSLAHGQLALFCRSRSYSVGDTVLAVVDGQEIVKKITKTRPGEIWLEGTNSACSTDSRDYGWLPERVIKAKLLLSFPIPK